MKLIVGLGNPGRLYIASRHNVGFIVITALGQSNKIILKKEKSVFSLIGRGRIERENVALAMPLTFMNLSGIAVKAMLKKFRLNLEDLLVVCDDLDLDFGRIRLRPSGSSGGHRGLKSIASSLGEEGFARLRVGIGRPSGQQDIETAEYVLSPFNGKEKGQLKQVTEKASQCCASWITKGVLETMSIFNKRCSDE